MILNIDNNRSAVYTYDNRGNVTKAARTDGVTITNDYDKDGRHKSQSVSVSQGDYITTTFTYENGDALNDDKVTESEMSFGALRAVSTDGHDKFGRLTNGYRCVEVGSRPFGVGVTDGYEYAQGSGTGTTTEKLSKVTHGLSYNEGNGGQAVTLPTESFSYDADGNITTIARSDGDVRYEYDKLGRLTREDNERLGKTWTYAYDAGGNITEKLEYAYTKNENPGTVTKEDGIVNDPIRKDRLKTYYGKSFAYDDKGFPTTYKGVSLAWNYRRLTSYGSTGFTYDADNVRRTKKANGTTTTYYYEGNRLLAEKRGTKVIRYMYDHSGLTGIVIDGAPYIYLKNASGEITGIYNDFGAKVASYAYDAWGNCTVYTASGALDENASSIGNTNPFRYRGYYYDVETKLYYLINRYYDPEVGRFISPDHIGYMLEQMDRLNGCNLYAYCLNNPVMETDPEGKLFISALLGIILGAAIGAIFGGVTDIVSQGKEKGWSNINWGQVAFNAGMGALTGAFMASPLGAIGTGIAAGGVGFMQSIGNDLFDNNGDWSKVNWTNATVIGVTSGIITGFGKALKNLTKLPNYDDFIQSSSAAVTGLIVVAKTTSILISILTAGIRSVAKGIINALNK